MSININDNGILTPIAGVPNSRITAIEGVIPNDASSSNKLATANDVSGKQDALTQGDNITIAADGTISATDTTYESKTAASGGSDISLVTTGEKYIWNNKANTSDIGNLTNLETTNKTNLVSAINEVKNRIYFTISGETATMHI